MLKSFWVTTAIAGMLLATSTACTARTTAPETPPAADSAVTAPPPVEAQSPLQTAQASLLTYDETSSGIPVMAQYPNIMEAAGTGSSEGVGVFFTFKPQGNAIDEAEVHVFLPSGTATAAEQEPFVTGPNGLMESNGWMVDSTEMGGSAQFPYDWVEMVIHFSSDMEQSGHILLGQTSGQAVQVTLLYPAEMADAYWPAAKTILESLEFDTDLLPVTTSSEAE